jgi:hypothetical protein
MMPKGCWFYLLAGDNCRQRADGLVVDDGYSPAVDGSTAVLLLVAHCYWDSPFNRCTMMKTCKDIKHRTPTVSQDDDAQKIGVALPALDTTHPFFRVHSAFT